MNNKRKKRRQLHIPPTYFFLSFLFIVGMAFFPGGKWISFPYNWLGALIIITGFRAVGWAYYQFKAHDTPESFDESTCLVCNGPYRYSRNPMYVGMVLILAGMAFCVNNYYAFCVPLFFFAVIHFSFIPFEENKMYRTFGKSYLDYRKRVRKWI